MTKTEDWLSLKSVDAVLISAFSPIRDNVLLPPQVRENLIDALGRAYEAHEGGLPSGSFNARLAYRQEAYTLCGERANKILADAQELLATMRGDVLNAAKHGDWEPLKAYLRTRPVLSKELADFLIAILDGRGPKPKRPPGATARPMNRPPSVKKAVRDREIIWFVLIERELNRIDPDKSIDSAAEKYGLGRRRVQQIASSENLDAERPILVRASALDQEIEELIVELMRYREQKCELRFAK
jgi:hypothetical protein